VSEQTETDPEPTAEVPSPLLRRATLRDVASRAGVSTAAASKVLRGAYGVSPAMRERVQEAMAALSYRPNASARGMRGKTFTVGVLISDIQNQFYDQVMSGVAPVFADAEYAVLIAQAAPSVESELAMVETMIDHRMDGLVLMTPTMPRAEIERFASLLPVVVVARGGGGAGFDTVSADDEVGSALIIDHLVGLGHRSIAHITVDSPDDDPTLPFRARTRGYEDAMRRHGLEERIDVISTGWTQAGGVAAAARLLERHSLPTAIHAGADVAALGLLATLWDRGVGVPGDVSVAGYDNSPIGMLAPISLTSVDQGADVLGRRAAELLLERIGGRTEPRSVRLRPTLVTRGTTAPPRA
jgi:LacI family transcriptional regulator, galactose operon repressor